MTLASAAQCTADDFIYEYTTCDERGERWRVAVPKHEDLRCDGGSPLPTRGTNCCEFRFSICAHQAIAY